MNVSILKLEITVAHIHMSVILIWRIQCIVYNVSELYVCQLPLFYYVIMNLN